MATDRRLMGGPNTANFEQVAVDGKTIRRSLDRRKELAPIHLFNAYAYVCEAGLALAQVAVPAKSHETAVIAEILAGLDVRGCPVSMDAGFCQKAIANQIREQRADYLICLTGNQPTLHAEVREWFELHCFKSAPNRLFHHPHDDYFDDSHGHCPEFAVCGKWLEKVVDFQCVARGRESACAYKFWRMIGAR